MISLCDCRGVSESPPGRYHSHVKIAVCASMRGIGALQNRRNIKQLNGLRKASDWLMDCILPKETPNLFASLHGEAGYDTEC